MTKENINSMMNLLNMLNTEIDKNKFPAMVNNDNEMLYNLYQVQSSIEKIMEYLSNSETV